MPVLQSTLRVLLRRRNLRGALREPTRRLIRLTIERLRAESQASVSDA